MVAQNFNAALRYVLKDEGGNDDDPRDRGGRTSRGITQRVYNSWCKLRNKPEGDVWLASDADVRAIYYDQYWLPYCDKLPPGIDYLFFDISVNAGRQRAVKTFQKALGVTVDGMMGEVTRSAIMNHEDHLALIREVSEVRRNFYRNLEQFPIYGRGWLNRTNHCEDGALALASGASSFDKPPAPGKPSKDEKPAGPTVNPETSGSAAGGMGTITVILQQMKEMLEPYQYIIKPVMYITLALTVAMVLYTGWSFYKKSKIEKVMQ
jgi:lysozyme family protein